VFHDKTAILYAASSKISVRGNVAVRFYLHRDSFVCSSIFSFSKKKNFF